MPTIDQILSRIDAVHRQNSRIEILYLVLTTALFLSGIFCMVMAIVSEHYIWASPSVVTTALLHWPLKEIKDIRRKNIALATAPILITQLPPDKAAAEIEKLLEVLYESPKK